MTIDWTKPIETVDGRPARVLATDVRDIDISVGTRACVLVDYGRHELPKLVRLDGSNDLLVPIIRNKRAKREGWINLYRIHGKVHPTDVFGSKAFADAAASGDRIDCVRFEWEE